MRARVQTCALALLAACAAGGVSFAQERRHAWTQKPESALVASLSPLEIEAQAEAAAFVQLEDQLCDGVAALSDEQAAYCRALFHLKIMLDQRRIADRREAESLAREARARALRERSRMETTPLEFFLAEPLEPGDVVVTGEGAFVYVGRAGATPNKHDFVPLESRRSPLRARADSVTRATRPR